MSFIKYSDAARADLTRLHDFLAVYDAQVAARAVAAIVAGIDTLAIRPVAGSPLPHRPQSRKLVVDFGVSGYLVFHKRYENRNTTLVTRIIHQKEWYDPDLVGLSEEAIEQIQSP